jgi:hypothetical protein
MNDCDNVGVCAYILSIEEKQSLLKTRCITLINFNNNKKNLTSIIYVIV